MIEWNINGSPPAGEIPITYPENLQLRVGDMLVWNGLAWTPTEVILEGWQNIHAGNITSGFIDNNRLAIDASRITSGTIDYARLPQLNFSSGEAIAPFVSSISVIRPNATQDIEINGAYFTPITFLSIPNTVINSLSKSPTKIIANITTGNITGSTIPVTLKNGDATNNLWDSSIKVASVNPDPFVSSISLFIRGNGENNSTTIIDSSASPKNIVRIGDTRISTVQSKYNGSSIYFDGSGDLLQITDQVFNFGVNNFTIEFWIYPQNSTYFLGKGDAATAGGSMFSFAPAFGCSTYFNGGSSVSPAISFNLNQWQHIAIVRNNTSYTVFKNGVLHSSANFPTGANLNAVTSLLQFGGYAGAFTQGYFSHIRITNAVRYTAAFNPESDTYLNI